MSDRETSAHEEMEEHEPQEKAREAHGMKNDSDSKEDPKQKNQTEKEDNQNYPVSEPSPSISLHSPSPSSPHSLRPRKSPSPSLHSLSDSPISEGHYSTGHGGGKLSPAISSPESSIPDDHFSPIGEERFSPPVVVAHRFQVEPKVVTKVDPAAQEGFVGVKDVEQTGNRRFRPDVSSLMRSKKVATWSKVLLGLRMTAFVFCLISFSVLASDKEKGWAQDSFYLYKEFRYSLSVNVIGFVYSGLQICDLVKYLMTRTHIVEHQLRGYFNFALDQILTYLLMSASSSAATRAYEWESYWGEDKFPNMANASVVLSFGAFVAFALASLVSGSVLCRFR